MFKSVLVVCIGNICRSPVGERVIAEAVPGLKVGSAGLHAMGGQGADRAASEAAAAQGVALDGHIARQLTAELGAGHDLILVMEKAHRDEIARRMPQLVGRTMLFGQWLQEGDTDIADPYQQAAQVHHETVAQIRRAGAAWAARLKPKE